MNWQFGMPVVANERGSQVILVEAEPGQARRERLQQWLGEATQQGAMTWLLSCDRDEGGPWAGLGELFGTLLPTLEAQNPALITKHDYELAVVLPAIQRTLKVRNPSLTELSPDAERTRNYAADRAFRIVHGLIDLLDAWYKLGPGAPCVIACDSLDRGGALARRFFVELMRRRGRQLRLTLLVTASPGQGEQIGEVFSNHLSHTIRLDLPPDPPSDVSPEEMARRAQELTEQSRKDLIEREILVPRLITCWQQSNQPEKALNPQLYAFTIYATRGFYEDALVYGEAALKLLEQHYPDNLQKRLEIYMKMFNCYAGLNQGLEGLRLAELALSLTDDPEYVFAWCYVMAMLYSRYLPDRDLAKAEAYLDRGLKELARTSLPDHIKFFQTAFNRNGLALVRHFQRRPEDAIELCQSSFDKLQEELGPDEFLLHRSVLLYNIAQVYAQTGPYEEAIAYYTATMKIDPNYSEYYNERGNVYLKMGRLEEAIGDYMQAIELSPPYMEVWTNLGQCYALMGRCEEAIDAYSRAIDLDPHQTLPFVGRAQACEALGHSVAALGDYSAALELNPRQPEVLANRAVLRYESGDVAEALHDVSQALALAPDMADLYQNRAVALADLGRIDEAMRDLRTYLKLRPDAEDRLEVEQRLADLQAGPLVA
ncbi:MAG TPA: tetratricopeptide repeat protein [Herpetosiphonaceae bacterium]